MTGKEWLMMAGIVAALAIVVRVALALLLWVDRVIDREQQRRLDQRRRGGD